MTEAPPAGRRELNKARTHEAILGALRDLVAQLPAAEVTVDQVAERAGISRRTFFNYFGSIPAALSAVFAEHASGMISRLDPDQVRLDPLAALRRLVQAGEIPTDLIGWLSDLNSHGQSTDGQMLLERTVWADMAGWLREQLHALLPEADPLFVATLSSAVMSCFQAAEETWVEDPHRAAPLSPADTAAFHDHLDRALGLLASGWRSDHD
ncbi:hypothetical protein SGUI_2801 [Serinicoccus hydrothermalis]|uniref:HTH tetR-type domain-containing protein n=1 Tax=Serinicoccus hydrothermalis TaxID=1758689 RepID=A0A1B1NFJ1_9MICO|nr:TetR/AcrR family transcriptional regulator [Serinicoccus hydrothermalis]ANS80197.1 hypothetical protein SGUI_2801 [Serinicoccus hydrothermalis]